MPLIGDHQGVPGIRGGLLQAGRAAPRPLHLVTDSGYAKRDGSARYASRRYTPFVVKLTFKLTADCV